jgi:sortase A
MWISRIIGGVGRVLVTAGALILLFVAYQLWGTGIHTARAQSTLQDEFTQTLATATTTSTSTSAVTTTTAAPAPGEVAVVPAVLAPADLPLPSYGDPIAQLKIPKIGVDAVVVEGESLEQLKRGPAHYEGTPLPGQRGNSAIAGHRTTYGAPFHNLDKLEPGDQIVVQTMQGEFVYEVDVANLIVKPHQVEVLDDKGDNRITLTACHPKYSLRERIIVSGVLVGQPAPPIVGQDEARQEAVELAAETGTYERTEIDGDPGATTASSRPAIAWGLICAAVWLATWLVSRLIDRRVGKRRRHRWVLTNSPYVVGVPVFLVCLYAFFEQFANLLPAGF